MILDICYLNESPVQVQGVRWISIYPHNLDSVEAELVIHHYEHKPQENIPLKDIHSINISND